MTSSTSADLHPATFVFTGAHGRGGGCRQSSPSTTAGTHGYLIVSPASCLFVDPDPGPVLANYGLENLRFLTPVYPGDALTVTLTCKQISPRDGEYGEVCWDAVWSPNRTARRRPRMTC